MRDPKMQTYTNMYANTDTWNRGIVNLDLPAPSPRQNVARRVGISDRARNAVSVSYTRLAENRRHGGQI